MDFPVCPACHQSVIDDDAVDCPFCGASMKAKPGAKPAAPAAKTAAPAAKPAAPAAKKPVAKPLTSKPTLPGDDFPFEMELTSGKSAIPSMPNPSKQRTWKVVCPMCDTPGYLAPTAAGQEVRCANPKCVMPIFTAPSDKKDEPTRPIAPPKKSKLPLAIVVIVLLLLGVGGGAFFFLSPKGGGGKKLTDEEKAAMNDFIRANKPAAQKRDQNVAANNNPKDTVDEAEAAQKKKDELIKLVLKQMKDSSQEGGKAPSSKPFCRQLSAEANAIAGDAKEARSHLDQLLKVGETVTYFRVNPLLELYWREMSAGKKADAAKTLKMAMTEVPKMTTSGRTRLEIAGRLAAALVHSERIPEALKLLEDVHTTKASATTDLDAQLAARLQLAMDGRVTPISNAYSVLPWMYPQAVAATGSLITRKAIDAAGDWAVSQTNDDAKAECLAIWAEEFAFATAAPGSVDADGTIAAAVEGLPPALVARIWARAGMGRVRAKDQAGANAAIKLAQEQLDKIAKPVAPKMPTIQTTHQFKLPASEPFVQAVAAASEVANLQAQSAETLADAEKSLETAMAFADAIAPPLEVVQQRQDEAEQKGPARLRDELKKLRKLRNDDEARSATNLYRKVLSDILAAAQRRFNLQVQLLSRLRAAGVGLNSKVWIIVNSRTTSDDADLQDNFFNSELPGELAEALKGTDEERAIQGAWLHRYPDAKISRPIAIEFRDRLKSDVAGAVKFLFAAKLEQTELEQIVLQTASQLAEKKEVALAFDMIDALPKEIVWLRENCDRFVAALATKQGLEQAVWDQAAEVKQQTEKISICRGLIAGLLED